MRTVICSFLVVVLAFVFSVNASARSFPPPCTVAVITGPSSVCMDGSATLDDASTGGAWSSSNPSIATIGTGSGVVAPVAPGTVTITYTLSPGCTSSSTLVVGVSPVTISGPGSICFGSATVLTDATPGGTWTSTDTSVIKVGYTTGLATAVGMGSATVNYVVGGCSTTISELVNLSLPPIGNPGTSLCPGDPMTLSESYGAGTWTSSNPSVATISLAGGVVEAVSGGLTTITYTAAAACYTTTVVTINPGPAPIAGGVHVCLGASVTLTDALPGGFWSSTNNAIATISGAGTVTGVSGGLDTIVYTSPTGCARMLGFTVIALPAPSGSRNMCAWGDTMTVTDDYPGGIYVSTLITMANLGGGAGRITADAPGTATFTYTIPAGCSVTSTITVNPLPALISGVFHVCAGFTGLLADTSSGGTWSSGNDSVATIGATTGIVTGVSLGGVQMFYTLPTGCKEDTTVYVSAPPSLIDGDSSVCVGATALIFDSSIGGSWFSSNPAVASVVPGTGAITGVAPGTVMISYSLGGTCAVSRLVTVYPLPALFSVTGGGGYCVGGTGEHVMLAGSEGGTNYQLSNLGSPVGLPVAGTGSLLDFGLFPIPGSYAITATSLVTGCAVPMTGTAIISENPLPFFYTLTGGGAICAGGSGVPVGLDGSGTGVNYQLYFDGVPSGSPSAGTGLALGFGLQTFVGTYTVVAIDTITGCTDTLPDAVTTTTAAPVVPSVVVTSTWGDTVCSGVSVTYLASAVNGGTLPVYQWSVNGANTATGPTYSYVPLNGDLVSVLVTSNATCATPDTASSGIGMTVTATLTPIVTISASPGTSVSKGQPVVFTAVVTGGGTAPLYQWELDGAPIAGATTATYTTSTLITGDSVTCMVTSTGTCGGFSARQSLTVTVSTAGVNNLITGNAQVAILPNPNKGEFTITATIASSNVDEVFGVEITNMLGQVVYKGQATAKSGKLDEHISLGHSLPNGMYLLSMRSGTDNVVTHMVIEQ